MGLLALLVLFVLCSSERPSYRLFKSVVIDDFVANVTSRLSDRRLAAIFETAFPNALDTTVHFDETKEETFIVTGDINAQWIRDSTNQVMPYVPFISQDKKVAALFRGLIKKQVEEVPFSHFFFFFFFAHFFR